MLRFLSATLTMAVIVSASTPAAAATRVAQNGVVVKYSGTTLSIPSAGHGKSHIYICAAGDIARSAMNARATDRIELTQVPGDGSYVYEFELISGATGAGQGIQFFSIRRAGNSMSVAAANVLCEDVFQR
jgi:hypothetical protein